MADASFRFPFRVHAPKERRKLARAGDAWIDRFLFFEVMVDSVEGIVGFPV